MNKPFVLFQTDDQAIYPVSNRQTKEKKMNAHQFAALAELLQSRHGPAERAARLVLVDGENNAGAARGAGITPAQAFNAVTRYRKAYALTLIVAGRTPSVEIPT